MECTVEYLIAHNLEAVLPSPPASESIVSVHWRSAFDAFQQSLREELWRTKSALDSIPEAQYFSLRDSIFPTDPCFGGSGRLNRDARKLEEILQATGVWEHLSQCLPGKAGKLPELCFVDLCGGPGSFSQLLFNKCPRRRFSLSGVGITLKERPGRLEGAEWLSDLTNRKTFLPTFGVDGTGDITKSVNLFALQSIVRDMPVRLVVADGNVDLPFDIANFQEVLHGQLIFSQWLAALMVLKPRGCMVLKLVDTFAPFTRSLLFLSTFFFARLQIVKPKHSRAVNSARFLVGMDFRGVSAEWMALLLDVHLHGFAADVLPASLVAPGVMESDKKFMESISDAAESVARNQIACINKILTAEADRKRVPEEAMVPPAPAFTGAADEFVCE